MGNREELMALADAKNAERRKAALADTPGASDLEDMYRVDEAAEEVTAPTAPAGMVKIKVFGVEQELPADEVEAEGGVEEVQKHLAASVRLQEAARAHAQLDDRKRKLDVLQAALAKQEAALQNASTAATPTAASGLPSGGVDLDQLTADLLLGDHDKAKNALSQIQTAATAAAVQIAIAQVKSEFEAQQLRERVSQQRQSTEEGRAAIISEMNEVLHEQFGDLVENPTSNAAIKGEFQRLYRERPAESPVLLVQEAASNIRALRGPPPVQRVNKQNLPTSGSASRIPVTETAAPSGSSIVEQMRKQRGQA